MKLTVPLPWIAAAALSLAAPVRAEDVVAAEDPKKEAKAPSKGDPAARPDAAKKPEESKDGEKPFADVVKDMEVRSGLFTFYVKPDENKILMEVQPEQIGRTFLFAATIDQAVGERGFYAAQVGADFPFVLRRVGKKVQWVLKNTSFTAEKGSPASRATARSFPDAVLGSAKVASRPHPDRKSFVIDASEIFSTDLPGFAAALNRAYEPTSYRFDKDNSGLTGVKAFPENVLLDVSLHYATDNPRSRTVSLADPRSIPMTVKYELSALKETAYRPRRADDRVGHFHTIQQDFTSDYDQSPYVRSITRWNVEKADPAAKLSPPKQPIVFWLENTIPVAYREHMTEGALLWNKAFERIGFQDVIVVKQQPDDADWDPADTRYNTIRWFATVDASFAIGPSRANPYTGEIYDADIGFSDGIIRNARRMGEEFVSPTAPTALDDVPPVPPAWAWGRGRWHCSHASGLSEQAATAFSVLEARGALSPEVEKRLMRDFVVEVTAHEVGHTLGLRHNFRGSSLLKNEELGDLARTSQVGQSASVMDYNPIVVAPKGKTQGEFVGTSLGPYDYWAIEYAYKPIEGDEKAELARIASRAATDPLLPYSTDEDALGTYSAMSIDPLANQWDQSNDPLSYFKDRVGLVHELWGSMEHKLARDGEGYQILRRSMGRSMNELFRSLVTSTKFVGGVYHYRDHVGDPGGRIPFVPVPATKQREALAFVNGTAFGEKAFDAPASVLNKLAVERLPSLDFYTYFTQQRLDYPWHDAALSVQRAVLQRLYHPVTLGRLLDNELRFGNTEKPFKMAEMFSSTRGAIWSELDKGAAEIPSLRRNLQREHLKTLIRLAVRQPLTGGPSGSANPFAPPPPPPAPEDATTLARASLTQIQSRVRAALVSGRALDATTKAHLQETQARIASALEARVMRPVE